MTIKINSTTTHSTSSSSHKHHHSHQHHHHNHHQQQQQQYYETSLVPIDSKLSVPPKPAVRLRTQRLGEKERLVELNHRLEDYLDKVRLLETENNNLIDLIVDLKQKVLANTATVKSDYEFPLTILKNSLNAEMTNEAVARLKLRRLAYLVEVVKMKVREAEAERKKNAEKIEELTKLNDNLEGEKEILKEKVGNTINDVLKNRVQLDNLMEKLNQVNDYLDKQTLERIQYQMENRRLMEDIGLCRANHDSDKNYLESINTTKNEHFDMSYYKSELQRTIQMVRDDFKRILEENRVEMETFYRANLEKMEADMKRREESLENEKKNAQEAVQLKSFRVNFADDLGRLKNENSELEKRFEEMSSKLESIRETNRKAIDEREDLVEELRSHVKEQSDALRILKCGKVTSPLESELKIYRKLLDIGTKATDNRKNSNSIKELEEKPTEPIYVYDSKVKNQKEIKGPVGIREVSFDSRCIVLENMSDKSEFDLSGWRLERTFEGPNDDQQRKIRVTLPDGTYLEKKSRINLWSGYVENIIEDFRSDIIYRHLKDWGTGSLQVTRLFDRNNEMKAIHRKNVIY